MADLEQLKSDIASLNERLDALNKEAEPIRKQLGNIDRSRAQLVAEKQALEAKVRVAKEAPRVSDHAVIRFLERKHGFDFETVRAGLLTPAVRKAMDMGADGVKVEGGTLKLREKCVVTFIGKGENAGDKPKHKRRPIMADAEAVWGVAK